MNLSRTRKRAVGAIAIAVTAAGLVGVPTVPASADPVPGAAFGATGEGDALVIRTLTAAGLTNVAGLTVGPTTSLLASLATPKAMATSANLGGAALGLGLAVDSDSQSAPPDHLTPSTRTLLAASLPGVLTTGAGQASDLARYSADPTTCLPAATALTQTSNRNAGVGVLTALPVAGVSPVVQTGPTTTTTRTGLPSVTPGTRAVSSETSASVGTVSLLGGAAQVTVSNTPVLEAYAAGGTAPRRLGFRVAPTATLRIGSGTATPLTATSQTFTVNVGVGVTATVKAKLGTPTVTADTPTHVAGTAPAVDLDIAVRAAGAALASTAVSVGQMSVDASVPTSGIQCADDVPPVVPAAPVITSPAPGSTVTTATPTISGTGQTGAVVTVTAADGTRLGTATVAADGTWSTVPSVPFDNGSVTVRATQAAGGQTSPAGTDTFDVAVPAPAPAAPVVTTPAAGSVTTDPTPTFTGTGQPGATVTVRDADGNTLATGTVAPDGSYAVTPTVPLANGPQTVTVTQSAGGTASPATTVSFAVASAAPTVLAPVITAPADGSTTTDPTPPISGTGSIGATVTVLRSDGTPVGSDVVGPEGTWSVTPTAPFTNGPVSLRAFQSQAGATSTAATVDFTVDAPAPAVAPPAFTSPADGSTTADPTPVLTGTGRAGATVTITDGNGDTVATVTVRPDDTWSVTPTVPFANGAVTLRAVQSVGTGVSPAASVGFTVAAPTGALDAPVIRFPAQDSTVVDTTPTITGAGIADAVVTVLDGDGNTVGTTQVNADGTWSLTPVVPFADGPVSLRATQQLDVRTSPSTTRGFVVAAPVSLPAPMITTPTQGSTTTDTTPAVAGTGTIGARIDLLDSDGRNVGSTIVDGNGNWSVPATSVLPTGPVTLRAVQVLAGTTSPAAQVDVTVSAPAGTPARPVVTSPVDGVSTSDTTPPVTGTGVRGATVTVTDANGHVVATGVVSADGGFSIPATTPLPIGRNTLRVTQTANGVTSDPTVLSVDVTPLPPVISSPADGATLDDSTPVVTGTGVAGAAITVRNGNGDTIGAGTVGSDGRWSVTTTSPLPVGAAVISVVQTVNGQPSEPTRIDVTVRPAELPAPVITAPAVGAQTDPRPLITGTGQPGATVTVTRDGSVVGAGLVNANGSYSVVPTTPFAVGPVTISATQASGGVTSPAATRTFVVSPVPVETLVAPVITSPSAGATITTGQPTITGTGVIGATVTVTQSGQGFQGSTVVGQDGTWSLLPSPGFVSGMTTITATQALDVLESGSSDPVTFTVAIPVDRAPGGTLTPLSPLRILDTRTGLGNSGVVGRQRSVVLQVAGIGGAAGVPGDGTAREVVLNVTSANAAKAGVMTVYPSGSAKPNASNVNYTTDRFSANLVTVPLGPDGKIVLAATAATDMVVDVQGWFSTPEAASTTHGRYTELDPARLVDTRSGLGGLSDIPTNSTRSFQVTGRGGVPATGVTAVVLNLTTRLPSHAGYLTLFPSGQGRPTASNLNFAKGESRANRVIVPVGPDGTVDVYNFAGPTQVVVDVNGYFSRNGDYFVGVSPRRIVDTRPNRVTPDEPEGTITGGETDPVRVAGQAGIPSTQAALEPKAVVGNITAIDPTAYGHLIAYPTDVARSDTSDLNYTPHLNVPNALYSRLGGDDGQAFVYSYNAEVHVAIDVSGYFVDPNTP